MLAFTAGALTPDPKVGVGLAPINTSEAEPIGDAGLKLAAASDFFMDAGETTTVAGTKG